MGEAGRYINFTRAVIWPWGEGPDEMDEIILSWPNVSLSYMDQRGGWPTLREFSEIEKGQYGHQLTVGQQLHAIRYHGTNYDICEPQDSRDPTGRAGGNPYPPAGR